MIMTLGKYSALFAAALGFGLIFAEETGAASRRMHGAATKAARMAVPIPIRRVRKLVPRPKMVKRRGFQPMFTDGDGSAVGFHPGPYADEPPMPGPVPGAWRPYRPGGIRDAMALDLLTRSNGYAYGYPFP